MDKGLKFIGTALWALVLIAGLYFYAGDNFIKEEKVNPVSEKKANTQLITSPSKNEAKTEPQTSLTPPDKPISEKYKFHSKEAIEAAKKFEELLLSIDPNAKKLISYIDVNAKNGHLLVNFKDAILAASKSQQEETFNLIDALWNKTYYVVEKQYGNWIEAKHWNEEKLLETSLFDSRNSAERYSPEERISNLCGENGNINPKTLSDSEIIHLLHEITKLELDLTFKMAGGDQRIGISYFKKIRICQKILLDETGIRKI